MFVSSLKMEGAVSFFIFWVALGVPTAVYSKVTELDVLGLIPGVSDREQVAKASEEGSLSSGRGGFFTIGGHRMPCVFDFIEGKLSEFNCFTGGGSPRYTEASNIQVHLVLKEGFTKKLGKPSSVAQMPIRTRLGVEYTREVVFWVDQKGNAVKLYSMTDRVDKGTLLMQSAALLEKDRKSVV